MVRRQSRPWLGASLALLLGWVALRGIGLSGGLASNADARLPPGWISLTTTLVLALAGWAHAYGLAGTRLKRRALLVAAGITCGLGGDLALSGYGLAPKTGFIVGMSCFGLGHVAYLAAMLAFARTLPAVARRRITGTWTVCTALCGWGWYAVIGHAEVGLGLYIWPVLGYSILLAGTAGVGLGLAIAVPRLWPLGAGGLLFVVSDFFIVLRLFNPGRDALVRAVTALDWTWLTYSPAQLLIVYTLPWVIVVNVIQRRRAYPVGRVHVHVPQAPLAPANQAGAGGER